MTAIENKGGKKKFSYLKYHKGNSNIKEFRSHIGNSSIKNFIFEIGKFRIKELQKGTDRNRPDQISDIGN